MGQASTSTHLQASRTNHIIYNPSLNQLTVKPLSSRARLGAAENFFSLRFLFNDPAKKVVIGNRGQCAFPFIFVLRDFVWSD